MQDLQAPQITVGAGLPAMAVCQAPSMLNVPPPSRASSYGFCGCVRDLQALQSTVGAGLPAMVVNDDAYNLMPSGALRLFASRPQAGARSHKGWRNFYGGGLGYALFAAGLRRAAASRTAGMIQRP